MGKDMHITKTYSPEETVGDTDSWDNCTLLNIVFAAAETH